MLGCMRRTWAVVALLAGASWFAGVTHFIVGVRQSSNTTNLSFALLALLAGFHTLTFVWLHHAPDVPQYVAAMRWSISSIKG